MKSKAIGLSAAVLFFFATENFSLSAPRPSEPINIGMVALLAAPQKYNGKVIRTWGFLNLRSDNNGLWLHKEDLEASLWKDSFALDLTPEQETQFKALTLTYVMLQGTLHSKGPEGPALNSGKITNITLVRGWAPYVPFERSK